MNTQVNYGTYSDAVKTYLSQKYHEEFTVEAAYVEFSGDVGEHIRLKCKGTKSDDTFTVRCYFDEEITSQHMEIDGRTHSVEDNYAELLCQNRLLQLLPAFQQTDCTVKCKVDFYGRQPTAEEYSQGPDACMKNEALRAYIKVYIISDGNEAAQTLYAEVEQMVSQCAPNTGYVYFAVPEAYDAQTAEQLYADNRDNFGNYLTNEAYAETLWFTLYENGSGLNTRKLIKG